MTSEIPRRFLLQDLPGLVERLDGLVNLRITA